VPVPQGPSDTRAPRSRSPHSPNHDDRHQRRQLARFRCADVLGAALYGNGTQEHASLLYYVISALVVLACLVATLLAYAAATRVSNASVRRPPRWLYLLYAAGYLVPVALFVRVATDHARTHTANAGGWEPMAGGMLATYCAIGALLMLGRASARGALRRAFWIFPPHWLDHEMAALAQHDFE
jgi:hypothetical protein